MASRKPQPKLIVKVLKDGRIQFSRVGYIGKKPVFSSPLIIEPIKLGKAQKDEKNAHKAQIMAFRAKLEQYCSDSKTEIVEKMKEMVGGSTVKHVPTQSGNAGQEEK